METTPFIPKKAITKDADLYAEITQNSTKDVARNILDLIPQINAHHRILDNGCGAGEVTDIIMATNPPPGIHIEAVDINSDCLDRLTGLTRRYGWPVTTTNMSSDRLHFQDCTFDLSIANFVVFLTPGDGIPAVKEMKRTLRPGGTAVFTSWADLPYVGLVKAAHDATRGDDAPPLREIPAKWWHGSHLYEVALEAGFNRDQVTLHTAKVYISTKDRRRLAEVMWSYLGGPATGWLRSDEDTWEHAIDVILQKLDEFKRSLSSDNPRPLDIGLTANILIAKV